MTPAIAAAVSCSVRSAHRVLAVGMLTLTEADRLCVRAGVHPVEVWGDEWFEDLAEDDREEAA